MPILIVILIGWFNWLVYSAHHRLQPLSAKMCLNRYLNESEDLFSFLNETPVELPVTGQQEFEAYLADNTTSSVLDYCHCNSLKYPHLYELHLLYHSIPATSAVSAAGYTVSPRRNSLADSSFEAMMMARCNRDLLDWWNKRYSDVRGITFVRYIYTLVL